MSSVCNVTRSTMSQFIILQCVKQCLDRRHIHRRQLLPQHTRCLSAAPWRCTLEKSSKIDSSFSNHRKGGTNCNRGHAVASVCTATMMDDVGSLARDDVINVTMTSRWRHRWRGLTANVRSERREKAVADAS